MHSISQNQAIEWPLEGKVALVTGASRGIGKETAIALAKHGADIAVNCLSGVDRAKEVASLIHGIGRRAVVARGDVSKPNEVKSVVDKTLGALGSVHILVNNAGIASPCFVHEMTVEEWRRTIDVDLTSVFLATRQVIPSMIERREGRIINISSVAAQDFRMVMGLVHYAAAKGGVISFTRALSREVAQYGITVNSIAPGTVATEISAWRGEKWRQRRNKEVPLGRPATPEEIAMTAVFLASPAGAFYTGQVLCPNGGESTCCG